MPYADSLDRLFYPTLAIMIDSILHVWRKITMIYQTIKIGNFVFALKDL